MAAQPVAGVAVWAHTGRGPHLSAEQRREVLETWREALPDRVHRRRRARHRHGHRGPPRQGRRAARLSQRGRSGRAITQRLSRELPVIAFYLYEAAGGVAYDDATLHAILELPGRHRDQGGDARFGHDLPADRRRAPQPSRQAAHHRRGPLPRLLAHARRARRADRHGRGASRSAGRSAAGLRRRTTGPRFIALSELLRPLRPGHLHRRRWRATSAGCSGPPRPTAPCRPTPATIPGVRRSRRRSARPSSAWSAMRDASSAQRDFERFKRELPRDVAALHPRGLRHRPRPRAISATRCRTRSARGRASSRSTPEQLETDRAAGLAFVVLKTVIAEDADGRARRWGPGPSTRRGCGSSGAASADGREGWTVTWKGRGWDRSFDDYLALVRAAGDLTRSGATARGALGQVSPAPAGRAVSRRRSTGTPPRGWRRRGAAGPLPLEKDFSPTLAGDALADERAQHPPLAARGARPDPRARRAGARPARAQAHERPVRRRLSARDAGRGRRGRRAGRASTGCGTMPARVAYGGWDLSERNLRVLAGARAAVAARAGPALVGTGNVCSGRLRPRLCPARAARASQLHTFFQLPLARVPGHRRLSHRARAPRAALPPGGRAGGRRCCELERAGVLHRRGGELRFLDLLRRAAPLTA